MKPVPTAPHRLLLIGGIGSGKSTVARILEELGAVVIDADAVGHEVIESAGPAFALVAERWPAVVADGEVDRRALGRIVFTDEAELAALESITHPHIRDRIMERVATERERTVVVEMPLIRSFLGTGWVTVTVDADDESRVLRATERGLPESEVRDRMSAQPTRREWLEAADLVIPNGAGLDSLRTAVTAMWRSLGAG